MKKEIFLLRSSISDTKNYKFPKFISVGRSFQSKLNSLFLQNFDKMELLNLIRTNEFFVDNYLLKATRLNFFSKIRHYKYFRLKKNLPIRGQRTHTNAKTRKKRRVK